MTLIIRVRRRARARARNFGLRDPSRRGLAWARGSRRDLACRVPGMGKNFNRQRARDFCLRIPSRRDLACGCPAQEQHLFPTKSPPNSSKDPNLSKRFDENGSNWWKWGIFACWAVAGGAWAPPRQPPAMPSHAPTSSSPYICLMCHFQFCRKRG